MKKILLILGVILLGFNMLQAQNSVSGKVIDAETKAPIEGAHVMIEKSKLEAITDAQGVFKIRKVKDGTYSILIQVETFADARQTIKITKKTDIGTIEMAKPVVAAADAIPQIVLTEDDQEDDNNSQQNVSELLAASRDPFISQANYNLRAARFRTRGYLGNTESYYLNGIPFNDLDDDRVEFGTTLGGLTGVTSNQTQTVGLNPTSFSFGNIGGSTTLDTRASYIRKTRSVGVSFSNRTYTNRITATYATGRQANGWAFALAGAKRWAQEGYLPGTNMDSYTYFGSVDKKINDKHSLNLTVFGSPTVRGKARATVREVTDLVDNVYYNANWGYQNGKKRNSSEDNFHLPTAILRHDFEINNHSTLTTAASVQLTRFGTSAMDWYNASNPAADYYSKLPTYQLDEAQKVELASYIKANPDAMQMNFDNFYYTNRNSKTTIKNADGIVGNDVTGNRSHYIIAERRSDSKEFNFNTSYSNVLNDNMTVEGGLTYQYFKGHNFNTVKDLLGGDFFVNVNQFAERAFPDNPNSLQNNSEKPNQLVKTGDTYGYDYSQNINKIQNWWQMRYNTKHFDYFAAINGSFTNFWRTGNIKSGLFPDNSLGKSKVNTFINYGVKGGVTYKLNGRHYLYANGGYFTAPPLIRDAYVSARSRDNVVANLKSEETTTGEVGYNYRAPKLKLRLSAYYTYLANNTKTITYYDDGQQTFVNYSMQGLAYEHKGLELGAEYKLSPAWSVNGLASVGEFIYAARPVATITQDNNSTVLDTRTVYIKNYLVDGTPQKAYSLGLRYNKNFWFVNVNANYFMDRWSDFNPNRRTEAAISKDAGGADKILKGSALWNSILAQEKLKDAYVINVNIGKSVKIKKQYINFNLSVDNVTNNKFTASAQEQLRFDFADKKVDKFAPRYYYAWGTNFLFTVNYRF